MIKEIDARGLSCPTPVLRTKEEIEKNEENSRRNKFKMKIDL